MSESNTLLPGQHWQCVILLSNSPFRQDWFSVLRLESLPHWLIMQCPACVQTERMYASRSGDNLIQLQFQWHYCDIVSSTSPRKKNTETAQTHGFLWKSGTPKSCDPQWIIIPLPDVSEPFFDRQTQRPFGDPNGCPNVTIALENGLDTHGDLEKMWHVWWGNLG